jgi:hypothetical protein
LLQVDNLFELNVKLRCQKVKDRKWQSASQYEERYCNAIHYDGKDDEEGSSNDELHGILILISRLLVLPRQRF